MPMHTLTPEDDGRRVAVFPGDTIVLRLPENPGAGFRWHAESEPAGAAVLENDDFTAPEAKLPGAGGQRVLSFRVARTGEFRLRVKLWREWEGDRSTIARHEFAVAASG